MSKKKVLQIVQHLAPGGIETMVLDFVKHAGPDKDVHVLSLQGTKSEALANWPRLKAVSDKLHFMNKSEGLDWRLVLQVSRFLKEHRISIVHTHHIGPLVYGGLAAKLAGVSRIVHTEHDAWHLENSRRRFLQDWICKIVKPVFVADAELVANAVKKAIPAIVPDIILNGIDTLKFSIGEQGAARSFFGLPLDARIIGCAARLEEVKGHRYLLDAVSHLPSNVHLVLAGDGSLRQPLENQVRELALEDRVHFLGNIDTMPTFHQALDVFCLPSEKEGLPLSPLEAQASGVPVVLTNVGGCREAMCPDTGSLVPFGDSAALASALKKILFTASTISPRAFVEENRSLYATVRAYEARYEF